MSLLSSLDSDQPLPACPNQTELLETDSNTALHEYSLVLLALNIPHQIAEKGKGYTVLVKSSDEAKARDEISAYQQENSSSTEASDLQESALYYSPLFKAMSVMVIGALFVFYQITGDWTPSGYWFQRGAGDADRILHNGEFYRLITSLTLHADLTHLLSNCLLGGIILHFFLQLTGNGLGLSMILLSSTLAGLFNVMVHGGNHHFVGFSTAIFATIGMLCSLQFISSCKDKDTGRFLPLHTTLSKPRMALPLMAGPALLAMLGASGARTDLGAHLFGLLCGMLTGTVQIFPLFINLRSSLKIQFFLCILTFALVYGCWILALQH